MKKIYTFIINIICFAPAFAQLNGDLQHRLIKPKSLPSIPCNPSRSTSQFAIDYNSADSAISNFSQTYFIWNMNMRYSLAAGDTSTWQRCIVRFDSLFDANTLSSIDPNTVTSITVDSFWIILGHENFSGTDDTLVVKLLTDSVNYPGSTTLWSNTMVFNTSLSPNDNWLYTTYLQWNPNYIINNKSFAIELNYYGDKLDTCGFIAGFNDLGPNGVCDRTPALSYFYPNSFVAWTNYVATYPLIPSKTGFDVFYDCNGNAKHDAGDGENYIQDIYIGAWITVNTTSAPVCGADFTITADTSLLHHYIVTNNAFGTGSLKYVWGWGDGNFDTIPYPSHTYPDSGFYNICLSITDSLGCTNTFCDSSFHVLRSNNYMIYMTVVPPVVTEAKPIKLPHSPINIYPSPATDKLFIKGFTGGNLAIFNVIGQQVSFLSAIQANKSEVEIDISKIPPGIYLLQAKTGSENIVKRFVKE